MTSVSVITLGCSKNTVDTEHLLFCLESGGFRIVPEGEPCDVLLINTCGFIGDAKEESVNCILECVKRKNNAEFGRIVVFGCLSQRYSDILASEIPEVDAWFGARDLGPVLSYLGLEDGGGPAGGSGGAGEVTGRHLTEPDKPYAYLKISEGCDRRCSYCAIPFIRGNHKSVPMEALLQEASFLASAGIRELILIAQDTTYYGLDLYGRRCLGELLRKLSEIEGIEWLRIHYSYPSDFPEDVLEQMASNPKVCKYLDIPLQHVSDTVLSNMRRGIGSEGTKALIRKLRERIPGVALRTTLIVGHPGEGEQEFGELLDFVRETRFERMGAFTYSEEEGTYGASRLKDEVPEEVKRSRYDELMELQSSISLDFNNSRIGSVQKLLVDDVADGALVCRSEFDSPEVDGEVIVRFPGAAASELKRYVGSFVTARITGADYYDLEAEIIE